MWASWWCAAIIALAAVAFVYIAAVRLGLISVKRCLLAQLVTVAALGFLVGIISHLSEKPIWPQLVEEPLLAVILLLLAAAPSFSLAASPLAMWWNRHR